MVKTIWQKKSRKTNGFGIGIEKCGIGIELELINLRWDWN